MLKIKFNTLISPMKFLVANNQLFIKREDLIPFSFGGNKVRIAQEYINDMYNKNCNCLISYGGPQSNLNRVLSNLCESLSIPCYIVACYEDLNINQKESFNTKLVKNTNAIIVRCNKSEVSDTIEKVLFSCKKRGLIPYYTNGNKFGKGNENIPVRAYVKAYEEILEYEKIKNLEFDYIFHASGTGMTQSGLICGKIKNKMKRKPKIIGVSIARDTEIGLKAITDYVSSYFENLLLINFKEDINFDTNYLYGGYGKYNNQIIDIIKNIYNTDGVALDSTYTGKAFLGMVNYLQDNNIYDSKVLFIHTGGTPLFFDDLIKINSTN